MERVYVLEAGTYLKLQGNALVAFKDGQKIDEIPAEDLKRLTLVGRASLTGPVLDFLIDRQVDTVFLTPTGRFRARILLDDAGHVKLRCVQYQMLNDSGFRLATARRIVEKKLVNQREFLISRSYKSKHAGKLREVALQIGAISKRLNVIEDLEALRGAEGQASKKFYSVFGLLIKNDEFEFKGRNKRPPKDPVNALLSFAYTLWTNEVMSAIKTCGLDPYLGALHTPHHGTPALVCDLVEEWRVVAENFVLNIINKRMVTKNDFVFSQDEAHPVRMTPRFLRAFIKAHEKFMTASKSQGNTGSTPRWRVHARVRAFISYLKGEEDF